MKTRNQSNSFDFGVYLTLILGTLAILPKITFDLFNVIKLLVIVSGAFGLFFYAVSRAQKQNFKNNRMQISVISVFIISLFAAVINSKAPLDQQIYGFFGRNTGLLTYLALALLLIGISLNGTINTKIRIFKALKFVLWFNVIYGLAQAAGIEFSGATLTYKVVGTFGNPNFISAFMGIGIASVFTNLLFSKSIKNSNIVSDVVLILLSLITIFISTSKQGILISIAGIGISIFLFLKSKEKLTRYSLPYLFFYLVGTFTALLGTLNKGPLAKLIYEVSVTYRGDYWNAGINMFKSNPVFGVGLDSYADYYRSARTLEAATRRGPDQISSAAHNVFIDFLAQGGFILFLTYLTLIIFAIYKFWKIQISNKRFEPITVSIFIGFLCYLAQSTISINNLSLVIWGWVFAGTLLINDENKHTDLKKGSPLLMTLGLVIGVLISLNPLVTDVKYLSAMKGNDPVVLRGAIERWPTTSNYITGGMTAFNGVKDYENLRKLIDFALNRNPREFVAWSQFAYLPDVSQEDKQRAFNEMKKLDPFNSNLK